ncbi:MAG TPA: MucB/RseB C-terminal domain-containing protein [Casimicrobiaceae bacterium]|jgi:sigma-E factor negative regulatory protein RseB|nr:MucB/RseB C-terminal domain-containing protein [Casimicrobiaceae bacterium]
MLRSNRPQGAVARHGVLACVGVAALLWLQAARADDAAEWLRTAANAAQQLNYMGTLVYQHDGRVETSRVLHMVDKKGEHEKLLNLDGPAREVIRNNDEVRCYYPDAKIIRIEPRTYRNAFPSLLPQQLDTLAEYYFFRKAEVARIAGVETQAFVFEPKDGMRYGHKLWADLATGLLLKAQLLNEHNVPIEQFVFTDIQIGVKIERDTVRPTYRPPPPDWETRESLPGDVVPQDTGWQVKELPPGFSKIVEGFRTLRGKVAPVAHLVFSDGLVAVSVFVEPMPQVPQPIGLSQQGGINVYSRQLDEHLVTVLGETPGATVRQIAFSVAHR